MPALLPSRLFFRFRSAAPRQETPLRRVTEEKAYLADEEPRSRKKEAEYAGTDTLPDGRRLMAGKASGGATASSTLSFDEMSGERGNSVA